MKTKTVKNAALYARLSSADLKGGKLVDESRSISNQRATMTKYCEERGWKIFGCYDGDDGVSGTTFERDDFKRMMSDVEKGLIDCVITVDLSRFGRNYIEAGDFRDKLARRGVRYVAILDGYDSENDKGRSMNIEVPIKEMFHELYPAEISCKVKNVKHNMAEDGKFCNSRAPYGYLKQSEVMLNGDKHILVVDNNVKHNVARIFEFYLNGMSARAIACKFNAEGIPSPQKYHYTRIGQPNPNENQANLWSSASIVNIIKNPAYYGAMSNCKREKVSYKSDRIDLIPFEDWVIVEDTHEPIVSKETWEQAQLLHKTGGEKTVRRKSDGEINIFAGVIKCGECGSTMVFNRKPNKSYVKEFFRCSAYMQKGKNACQPHNIDFSLLHDFVLAEVRKYAVLSEQDEDKLIRRLRRENNDFKSDGLKRLEKEIKQTESRLNKIGGLIKSLFEEKVSGNVSDTLFKSMTADYEREHSELAADLDRMRQELNRSKQSEQDLTEWVKNLKSCLRLETLTRSAVVNLFEKIVVSESLDENSNKIYDITLVFKFGLQKETEPIKSSRFQPNSVLDAS